MHTLGRNKHSITYAVYTGKTEIVDDDGYHTGEYTETYGTKVTEYMYVSAKKGNSYLSSVQGTVDYFPFGVNKPYRLTVITDNMSCPITEESLIWYGNDASTDPPNYTVMAVSKSTHHITYALKEIDIANA